MAMWEVQVPTKRGDGVRGVQTFLYDTAFPSDARARALADVEGEAATRHRRGAQVDLARMTVKPYATG